MRRAPLIIGAVVGFVLLGLVATGGGGAPAGGAGWDIDENGANLNDAMRRFMDRLRAAVPRSIPLVVTSGIRTPWEQASAMVYNFAQAELKGRDGWDYLRGLYQQDDLVEELRDLPRSVEAWAEAFQAQVARGRFLSRHMRGDALDLRTRNLTADQLATVKAAAERLGAKALVESDHLHLERIA